MSIEKVVRQCQEEPAFWPFDPEDLEELSKLLAIRKALTEARDKVRDDWDDLISGDWSWSQSRVVDALTKILEPEAPPR